MNVKQLSICSMMIVLFIISSKLVIPISIIPFTLQTFTIIFAGVLLQPKQIMISYATFLLMGLLGFPVFSKGGGIAYVLQPTFGFLIAFPFAACMISYLRHRFQCQIMRNIMPLCLLAIIVIYIIGSMYMYVIFNYYLSRQMDVGAIVALGVIPFIVTDVISAIAGCLCALRLQNIPIIQTLLASSHIE